MMLSIPPTTGAHRLSRSNAKWVAVYVGLALWLGALLARQQERQQRAAKTARSWSLTEKRLCV
jgi:hypothetical protein